MACACICHFFCVSLHPQRCMIEIKPYIEHAVLVGLITPNQPEERTKEYLDELAFLADKANSMKSTNIYGSIIP